MNDLDVFRNELSKYSRRSFDRHLVSATGGNLSVRIPGTDTVLVTPSGISLGDVDPEMNLLVTLDGDIIESPMDLPASKETGFHLAAYRNRLDVLAVAHVHPPFSTAYSCQGKELPLATISARVALKHVPCLECFMPGSEELCKVVSEGIIDHPDVNSFLMKEHGILALASTIQAAYYMADLIEDTAKIAFIAGTISAAA